MDKIIIHDEALEEYVESYAWYYERGSHIAEAFEKEVEHAIKALQEFPDRWPVYHSPWRRILLRRFPFGIVYGLRNNQVVIIAIMHTKKRPHYWKNRHIRIL